MDPRTKRTAMSCPKCGAAMNHHGEKAIEARNAEEAARTDPRWGGVIEEAHTCPRCGTNAARPGF